MKLSALGCLFGASLFMAATAHAAGAAQGAHHPWSSASVKRETAVQADHAIRGPHAVVGLDRAAMRRALRAMPFERPGPVTSTEELDVPMPDGTFVRLRVEETRILAPELAAAFPDIRTYRGVGVDDPTVHAVLDWTPRGFHAMVRSAGGTVYVDPLSQDGETHQYVSFNRVDYQGGRRDWVCLNEDEHPDVAERAYNAFPMTNGTQLRTYKLALAATGEYTVAASSPNPASKTLALARMTTTMNRVNGIYENDLAVRMVVATGTPADPTALIYLDGTTDPYTNNNGSAMLTENQTNIDAVVGSANYDIGHVFSTAGGGVAGIGVTCNSPFKAWGVTGLSAGLLFTDVFAVDYVSHEMGHQFNANHTFNGTTSSCGGSNRSATHAFEVGSGSTIMAYAYICGAENIQLTSDAYFHVESLNEITAFITSGTGATCGVGTATGNAVPVVSAPASYSIPARTPFALTATASDANGDSLLYTWEEFDLGTASSSVATATTDDGSRPLFRSYTGTTSPTRTFPSLTYVLNHANTPPLTYTCTDGSWTTTCLVGETLPTMLRTMKFQVTVRDRRAGGGAIATAMTQLSVVETAGPFTVTTPNTAVSWAGGTAQTISWSVSGTLALAANVRVLLSTDGGLTFPYVLSTTTPNDGTQSLVVPAVATTQARVKVEAVGNVFFDISDANFTITVASGLPTLTVSPTTLNIGAINNAGTLVDVTPAQRVRVEQNTGTAVAWTAATTSPWLTITNATGLGDGAFQVALNNTGNTLPATGVVTGTISLVAAGAQAAPPIPVRVTLYPPSGTTAPYGLVDTPAQGTTGIQGSIGVTGWALDDVGVSAVRIYRNCLVFEPAANCATIDGASVVYVGDATFTADTRPDVEGVFGGTPQYAPQANRAGWGYLMLTNMAPHVPNQQLYGGQGTLQLYARAIDEDGRERWLGRTQADTTPTTITMANDSIAKPFGAIDTPGQGQTKSGTFPNFGWALTPDSNTVADPGDILVPVTGSSILVWVDSVPLGNPEAFNLCRGTTPVPPYCDDDIASIFGNPTPQPTYTTRTSNPTRFRNLDAGRGAIGYRHINTTTLANGLHTIQWSVYDSASRGEGIGSRYFSVLNTGGRPAADTPTIAGLETSSPIGRPASGRRSAAAVRGRTGLDLDAPLIDMEPDADGVRHVRVGDLDRMELAFAPVAGGYLDVNGDRRPLPVGSALDAAAGHFAWAPGVGFFGNYRLVFEGGADGDLRFDVTVRPVRPALPGATTALMALLSPKDGQVIAGAVTIEGWAFDPEAGIGSGIDAVHVWARRLDVPGLDAVYLGSATPAAGQAGHASTAPARAPSAFTVRVAAGTLAPGAWEIVAYVWSHRMSRWEDARTVRITVK